MYTRENQVGKGKTKQMLKLQYGLSVQCTEGKGPGRIMLPPPPNVSLMQFCYIQKEECNQNLFSQFSCRSI